MKTLVAIAMSLLACAVLAAQSAPAPPPAFEVATIKPVESSAKSGRYIVMQGPHRFVEKDYTLKLLIAAAYNLNPKAVAGGPRVDRFGSLRHPRAHPRPSPALS